MNAAPTEEPDLIARLRSSEGPAVRASLMQQLDELEGRILARLRTGLPRSEFEMLDSVRLAIEACRDTLNRIKLSEAPGQPGPLNSQRFLDRSRS